MSDNLELLRSTAALSGSNANFIEEIYEQYLQDPGSVSNEWRNHFDQLQSQQPGAVADVPHSPVRQHFALLARDLSHPTVLADNKPGQWNTFLIRMVGDKVSIWLNDKLIVDRVALENYWDKTGVIPLVRADQIELQHHGSELFFKNLYIRELPY